MSNPIRGILRQTQQRDKLNILCADTHERYQSTLALTGHNFFSIKSDNWKQWNKDYAPIPKNYYHIEESHFFQNFINQIDFDIILSQHKFGQYQTLEPIARQLHVPLLNLEHTVPPTGASGSKVDKYEGMTADVNVYIAEYSLKAWNTKHGINKVIYHGFDLDFWKPFIDIEKRKPQSLTVVNDFINRDRECGYKIWHGVTFEMPRSVYGDTPGLSRSAYSTNDLLSIYNNHQIYINTSITSTIPMAMLEAAACGCAIVTTETCAIPEIFKHNENCLMSNDPMQLRSYIIYLMNEPDELKRLSQAARQTVIDRMNIKRFVKDWNDILKTTSNIPYVGATNES